MSETYEIGDLFSPHDRPYIEVTETQVRVVTRWRADIPKYGGEPLCAIVVIGIKDGKMNVEDWWGWGAG